MKECAMMDVLEGVELAGKKCKPCEGGVASYSPEEARRQIATLGTGWTLSADSKMIVRNWRLKNFVQAMKLVDEVARIAEEDQHHPDLHVTGYRNVAIELTTHAIGGLSENDFILAAKIDRASVQLGL